MNHSSSPPPDTSNRFHWGDAGGNLLAALGSLRLTVFLLSLGLVLVLIATLQQTKYDIYQVKQNHFSRILVHVPFQEIIIPAWFPETQSVEGGFLMPSGVTVMVAMLVNLVCAHILRFRIQASGRQLVAGLVVLGLGIASTLLVIMNGNFGGFQEDPLVSWETQRWLLLGGLGLAGAAGLVGGFRLGTNTRRLFSAVAGAGLLALGGYLASLGSSLIGDEAMRVLWRLVQGSVAAVICYVGAVMVFRRKAGIVLVHSGILLLMIGELYTTWSAIEQRMSFFEGQTSQHTFNVDESEIALITAAHEGGREQVITIDTDYLVEGEVFDDPRLPVRLKPLQLFPNSAVLTRRSGDLPPPGARGLASVYEVVSQPPVTGANLDGVNMPGGYVELLARDRDESLGVFLLSALLYRSETASLDRFEADGKSWQIGLRYEHYYKPYSVKLIETDRENYIGTRIARSYSSRFRILDPDSGVDEIKRVSMNEPLRYNNETFYQAGHAELGDGRELSTLQIVRNTGWLIPYVSCTFVGIGLLMHFLSNFVRFAERLAPPATRYDKWSRVFVAGSILISAIWAWREFRPATVEYESMNLTALGQLPVVAEGRIQPLDSVARTLLRECRKRETVPDGNGTEQPAIRWLADWIFDEPGAGDYLVFKVDDPEIQSALDLVRRKRNMYSWAEINRDRQEFDRMLEDAQEVERGDASRLTLLQKRVLALGANLSAVERLRLALARPDRFDMPDRAEILVASRQLETAEEIVKAVPDEASGQWTVLSPLKTRYWLADMARDQQLATPEQLAGMLIDDVTVTRLRDRIFENEMMILIGRFQRASGRQLTEDDLVRIQQVVREIMNDPDPENQANLKQRREEMEPDIAAELRVRLPQFRSSLASEISRILPVADDGTFDWSSLPDSPPLVLLDELWEQRDADRFNQQVQQHLNTTRQFPEVDENQGQVSAESFYNQAAPFYVATAIYIMACLLTLLSWVFLAAGQLSPSCASLADGLRRSAFWVMVVAFAVHTVGLVLRIYISGRPPVTNLYSSAVFIGWAAALFGMFVERITGHSFGTLLSSVAGFVTLLIAFSLGTDGDTFSVLVAVLDTQFWLSTHVVCITLGYSATFVAGTLGMLYLIMSVLVPVDLKTTRGLMARLIYGVTCFALLCSFVGTVLGGLWADDSWGRFWGWDPKENGALMIVLANALLLHARWAGLARDRGVAMLAVLGNIVTIWSWFAVNELGVGLHQYGITEGRMFAVAVTWLANVAVIGLGLIPSRFWLVNLFAGGTAKA